MFAHLESLLLSLATKVPLELFAPLASFVEEIVAPIPSPTVMVVSGSLALVQGKTLFALIPLVLLGALGKTLGGLVVYVIADKAEDFIMEKFGKYFGVTSADVERFREKVGEGARGYVTLTLLRALPFVPSSVISVGSGIIKVPLRIFVVSTFLGTIVRDGFYIYTGYAGAQVLALAIAHSGNIETYLEAGVVIAVLGYLGYKFYKKSTTLTAVR